MALNKPSIATLEAKHHFLERCHQNNRTKFSLLITGNSAVGKSSLVNALVGKQVAEGRRDKVDKVIPYDIEDIDDVIVRVWDSPGLIDDDDDDEGGAGNDEEYPATIESEIIDELDVVILCLKMDDARFHRDDRDAIKILTENFGKELWKNAVIALTFANKVEDPAGGDRKDYFEQDLANWREAIHLFLSNTLKLDPELVQSLPIVPTGYYRPLSILPIGGNWLSKLWIACDNVARKSTAFSMYRINSAGERFPVSFRLRRLKKDEEQQDSFWKKTWELFKECCFRLDAILGISEFLKNWRNNQQNRLEDL